MCLWYCSLVPRPHPFYFLFAFTIIHGSGRVYYCQCKLKERPGNGSAQVEVTMPDCTVFLAYVLPPWIHQCVREKGPEREAELQDLQVVSGQCLSRTEVLNHNVTLHTQCGAHSGSPHLRTHSCTHTTYTLITYTLMHPHNIHSNYIHTHASTQHTP